MGLRKGITLINLKSFLDEHVGPSAWERLLKALPAEDRQILALLIADGWYELALHARVNRAFCDLFYDGSLAMAETLGRYSAERDLGANRRVLLRLVQPSFALKHMDIYWRDDEDTGHWQTTSDGNHVRAELSGWEVAEPALCRRLLGYITRVVELFSPVSRQEHKHCRAYGYDTCVFDFLLEGESAPAPVIGTLTKADIRILGQELCHLPDQDSVEDAVVDLLQFQFGFARIELWSAETGSSELTLHRSVGTRTSSTPVRFVLQTADRKVGRIDIEGPSQMSDPAHYELLQELMPWIALALDGSHTDPQPSPPERFERRLLIAKKKWRLTPKQAEVLSLILRGERNKEIAEALGCEESTVEQHVTRIKRAADAKSRVVLSWKFWMEL